MTIKRVKRMNYMKTFKCIGGSCPDNCCIGWDVDIDKNTYDKYRNTKNSILKTRFDADVIKNKDSYDETIDYGRMLLKTSKRCPFLNKEALCDIQMTHGENFLSKVCNAYPRVVNLVDGQFELSATISCPEVARVVLIEDGNLETEIAEMDTDRFIIAKQVDTKDKSLKAHPAKYFNELRTFAMLTIGHANYTLEEKFWLLGKVHHQLLPLHSGGDLNSIPSVLKIATKAIETDDYRAYLKRMKSNPAYQLRLFNKYTRVLHGDSQIAEQRFGRYFDMAIKGLALQSKKTSERSINLYKQMLDTQVQPFMRRYEKVFENYILNAMYEGMYPFSEEGDPYAGYTMLVMRYLMLKVLLAGIQASGEELNTELLMNLIPSFSKTLEHHKSFMTTTMNEMMASEEDDIKRLSQLI